MQDGIVDQFIITYKYFTATRFDNKTQNRITQLKLTSVFIAPDTTTLFNELYHALGI